MKQLQECFDSERRWFETSPCIDVLGTVCAIALPLLRAVGNACRNLEARCENGVALERKVAEQDAMLDLEFTEV